MTVPGDQAHVVAIALQPQPVAVVFHFVEPVRGIGNGGGFGGETEVKGLEHAPKIGARKEICESTELAEHLLAVLTSLL